MPKVLRLLLWLSLGPGLAFAAAGAAETTSFAVIGDAPYSPSEEPRFLALLERINRGNMAFVIHVGDFKSGSSPCDDGTYAQRRQWFDLSEHPLIYTPGDNEWTDCYRHSAGGFNPLARLEQLRKVFGFGDPQSLGRRRIPLARQSRVGYPENARWKDGSALLATLNIQGSNNGYGLTDSPYRADTDAEFARRNAANLAWMREAAELAGSDDGIAVLFFCMQGDPLTGESGFRGFLDELRAIAARVAKPIVVVHGDTHVFHFDQPFRDPKTGARISNLWRIETWGSPWVGWVRVMVNAGTAPPYLTVEDFAAP
jgi:hypothetical protein